MDGNGISNISEILNLKLEFLLTKSMLSSVSSSLSLVSSNAVSAQNAFLHYLPHRILLHIIFFSVFILSRVFYFFIIIHKKIK
jgi:hypothetical protein